VGVGLGEVVQFGLGGGLWGQYILGNGGGGGTGLGGWEGGWGGGFSRGGGGGGGPRFPSG